MVRYDCVDSWISKVFYKYGKFVSRHKLPFLLIPLFFVVLFTAGLYNFDINNDVEYLFTPADSTSRTDLKEMQKHFMIGNEGEEYLPNRELDIFIRRGRLIITARDGGNILRKEIFEEILKLDKHIKTFQLNNKEEYEWPDNQTIGYDGLCMKWLGHCVDNTWLSVIAASIGHFEHLNLTYPFLDFHGERFFIGATFAKVQLHDNTDVLKEAEAVRLVYSLSGGDKKDELASHWEDIFEGEIDSFQAQECEHIRIARSTSMSLSREAAEAVHHITPRFAATFCMMILFAVFSCIMRDWVLSKPWLGFLGVLSASFAIFSSVGVLSFGGLQFNEIVALMPFLVLGVGVDNMFIMIAAWRHLSLYLPVEERMGRTFSEAAVSITITNLTDIFAFVIGSTINLPGIRVFCAYAGIAMVFVYVYQITFFAACMAFMGDREANNLHCYTCKKVLPKEEAPGKLYKFFCAGGISKNSRKAIPMEHKITKFFRLIYGPFVMQPKVKLCVVLGYLVYIGGAIYGCTQITEGLELKSIARDESPPWIYYSFEEKYFSKYGPSVSVVLYGDVEYWKKDVQENIEKVVEEFENTDYSYGSTLTVSWLRAFTSYLRAMNYTTNMEKANFLSTLERFVESGKAKQFSLDIDFVKDENNSVVDIEASRFLVATKDMSSTTREGKMMLKMRELAENSTFNISVFGPGFIVYDQYIGVLPNTLQTLGIAMACMFFVAMVMIPHPICAVFVTFCVISIDTAVIGYMSLWKIPLDPISMLNIILCIGFSIDFSAHITYAFVIAPADNADMRSRSALHALGMPILQGALSSIIAISVLSTAPVYVFRIFFKTLFLVMIFGAGHGLLVLPVILSYIGRWLPHKTEERERPYKMSKAETSSGGVEQGTKYKEVFVVENCDQVVELYVSSV